MRACGFACLCEASMTTALHVSLGQVIISVHRMIRRTCLSVGCSCYVASSSLSCAFSASMTAVLGHHPAFSGDQSFFYQDFGLGPESSAWKQVHLVLASLRPQHCMCTYLLCQLPSFIPVHVLRSVIHLTGNKSSAAALWHARFDSWD